MNFPKMKTWDQVALSILIICLIFQSCCGFYHFESRPVYYTNELWVKVNHVNSYKLIEKEIPLTFPFCELQGGVEYSAENVGKFIMGNQVENSPYRFKVNTNESDIFLCRVESLSGDKFKLLKESIDEMYQVYLILDNLPPIVFTQKEENLLRSTSYPIGFKVEDVYYLFNHLKFNVLIHKNEEVEESSEKPGYMVVGFEVIPCSVKHNVDSMKDLIMYNKYPFPVKSDLATVAMPIKEGQPVVFTYDVTFEESDIKWASRSDAYLKVEGAKGDFSVFLRFLLVGPNIAVGIYLSIIRWMGRWGFARYVELDKEAEALMKEESFGWSLVMADVFRTPSNPSLLCVMVGNGIQILGMTIVSLIFAALGLMSSVSRRTLIMGMLLVYMIPSAVAGYVAVRLWRTFNQKGWISIALKTTCLFGLFFSMLTSFNFILWRVPSSVSFIVISIFLWFCISVPLTLVGGYFGAKKPFIEIPGQTNTYPHSIPDQNERFFIFPIVTSCQSWIIFFELVHVKFILKMIPSIGFLSDLLITIVVFCVVISLIVTYINLGSGDWEWWWTSFFASASISISILFYFIAHLDIDLKSLSDPIFATELVILWLGYSLFMALATLLATGTIGFLSSFWFVHYLYDAHMLEKMKSQDLFIQNFGTYDDIMIS